jgi:hypothetical protein
MSHQLSENLKPHSKQKLSLLMKTYGEEDVQIHVFLTSALGKWSASRPGRFIPGTDVHKAYKEGRQEDKQRVKTKGK